MTSGGKNIAPQPIENQLISNKFVEQVLVVGDNRNYCTAIIVLSKEPLIQWLNNNKIEHPDFNDINNIEQVRELIRLEIDKNSTNLARYETIKDFYLTTNVFTIENDMLTPTLKVIRKVVEEKYKDEINNMYAN